LSSPESIPFEPRPINDQQLVMEMLSAESDATYTFQGLKRRLGLHQEKLTRILKRLEDDNLVAKTEEGYRTLTQPRRKTHHLERDPVIRGQLPPGFNQFGVLDKIKGRWFKNFRWVGHSHGADRVSLYWITEDNRFQVEIQLLSSEILVGSWATDPKDGASPLSAAYELFDRISRILPDLGDNS
jgi:hypothetical protein